MQVNAADAANVDAAKVKKINITTIIKAEMTCFKKKNIQEEKKSIILFYKFLVNN